MKVYAVSRGGHEIEVTHEPDGRYLVSYSEYNQRTRKWILVTCFHAPSEYQAVNLADQYFRPRAYSQPA